MNVALLNDLASVFGDQWTADSTGPSFTCTEADTIARVLRESGHDEAAFTWLHGHAAGDEVGDDHVGTDDLPLRPAGLREYIENL